MFKTVNIDSIRVGGRIRREVGDRGVGGGEAG